MPVHAEQQPFSLPDATFFRAIIFTSHAVTVLANLSKDESCDHCRYMVGAAPPPLGKLVDRVVSGPGDEGIAINTDG